LLQIQFRQHFKFGDPPVLRFDKPDLLVFALLGSNGAGKTTPISIACG
jgi:ABC-type Na+ transport system ATPase subunit NatA